jgi:hypothetical protein
LSGAAQALGLQTTDLNGIIDPATQALAQKNTEAGLSTEARLSKAHTDAMRAIKNSLAARGALRSGEAGYQLGNEQQAYTQAEYDSKQQLLDYLSSYQQGYLQAEQQRQQQLAQASSDAANRQQALPQNQPTPQQTAVFDSYAPDGQPLYRAPDGTLHLQDGSVYAPAPPPSAPPGGGQHATGLPQVGTNPLDAQMLARATGRAVAV